MLCLYLCLCASENQPLVILLYVAEFYWIAIVLGCIHYVSYRGGGGGQRILGGDLKFLEQKKGGYENCSNISWGDAYFL